MNGSKEGSRGKQGGNWSPDLTVIGLGRIGLVTALSFAAKGHRVLGVDLDRQMVAGLWEGQPPFFEPGLHELLARVLDAGTLQVSEVYDDRLSPARIHFVCVDTGSVNGTAIDLTNLHGALRSLSPYARPGAVVVLRSTVPPGTTEAARHLLAKNGSGPYMACNPEFLREGSAVEDFFNPDRVVLGVTTDETREALLGLYQDFPGARVVCHPRTAEMVKYAANTFLAINISFANEISGICGEVGADVRVVSEALRLDRRIGPYAYVDAGLGFGGPCLPKDIAALAFIAKLVRQPVRLLRAAQETNEAQRGWVIDRLMERLGDLNGRVVGIVGLAFKPDTDDVRAAPGLEIARMLVRMGAQVNVYDPLVKPETLQNDQFTLAKDIYEAADGADAMVLTHYLNGRAAVRWEQIQDVMRRPLLVDGRNAFDRQTMLQKGFEYIALGVGDELRPPPYDSLIGAFCRPSACCPEASGDGLGLLDSAG